MSDEEKRPDDVVEGFDLPETEPTPPPEEEIPAQAPGGFDLPQDEGETSTGAAPSGELAEGFDLPQGEAVPPPPSDALTQEVTEPHVKQAEKKKSVIGKFIALIIIPAVAIPLFFLMRQKSVEEQQEYREDYVESVGKFLKLLSDSTDKSIPEAHGMLVRKLRGQIYVEDMEDGYKAATKGLGAFEELTDVKWDPPGSGQPFTSFNATVKFENGVLDVWFKLSGKDTIRIARYKLGTAKKRETKEPRNAVSDYEEVYVAKATEFLKMLSAGDAAKAHAMLGEKHAEKVTADALATQFKSAADALGQFKQLADVKWGPIVGSMQASFHARAVFTDGSLEVWFHLQGYFSVSIKDYALGKR